MLREWCAMISGKHRYILFTESNTERCDENHLLPEEWGREGLQSGW